MKVIVKRSALEKLVKDRFLENRSYHSDRIDYIEGDEDHTPVEPTPMMATQLAVEMPPVEDPEYVPATTSELGRSAAIIAEEVPDTQIDFFYRMLHRLLDKSLDRSQSAHKVQESYLIKQIDKILDEIGTKGRLIDESEESEGPTDDELEAIESEEDDGQDPDEALPFSQRPDLPELPGEKADADLSPLNIAQAIADAGHTHRDAIHSSTSTMNLDFADIKSASQNFVSFGHKPRKVALPSEFSMHIVVDAFQSDDSIKDMFNRYLGEDAGDDQKLAVAIQQVKIELEKIISERTVISDDLAAQMHANILSDQLYSQADTDEEYESLVAKEIETLGSQQGMLPVKISGGRNQKKVDVPRDLVVSYLEKASQERVSGSQQDVFQSDEADWGDDPEVGLTQEEIDQIERDRQLKNLKKLDGLAPYFGFKNASGIRQWRRKFAEPKMKALLGSVQEYGAYQGYYDDISDRLSALLDSLEEASSEMLSDIESELESSPGDSELSDLQELMNQITGDLRTIQTSRNDSEEEELDSDQMLSLDGGRMLRFAFDQLFFKKEFTNFAGQMKKHMTGFLSGKGVDPKTASVFAKMFNGETDLVPLSDNSSGGKKLRDGGITDAIYSSGVAEHSKFARDFFTGARNKITAKNLMTLLNDRSAMKRLINDSLNELSLEDERHAEYLRATLPKDQEDNQQEEQG